MFKDVINYIGLYILYVGMENKNNINETIKTYQQAKEDRLARNELLVTEESALFGIQKKLEDTHNQQSHEFIIYDECVSVVKDSNQYEQKDLLNFEVNE